MNYRTVPAKRGNLFTVCHLNQLLWVSLWADMPEGGAIQSLSESKVPQARGLLPKDPVLYGAGFEGTEALVSSSAPGIH